MSRTVITLDEINLLKYSEEAKNTELYGNLYDVLIGIEKPKALSLEQLPKLDEKAVGALTYNKKSLMDNIKNEWYTERTSAEDPKKKIRCGLCNTPNRYLYYIRNRINNNVVNVGSRCMTNFPGIEGYVELSKQLKEQKMNQEKMKRRTEFFCNFKDPENTINTSEKYFYSLPILIPFKLYNDLEENINRMSNIYYTYINKGKTPFNTTKTSIELFQLAIEQFVKLKIQADEFINDNINNPQICCRSEIDWMINHNKISLLNTIAENNGIYTFHTIKNIYSFNIIEKYFDIFVSKNKSTFIKFMPLQEEQGNIHIILVKFGYKYNLSFTIAYQKFMSEIGARCITDDKYTFSDTDLLDIADIMFTLKNIESIISYIANIINHMGYIFLLDFTANIQYLYRKSDGAIRVFKVNQFMQTYRKYVLSETKGITAFLMRMIQGNSNTKWIPEDEQKKYGTNEKINELYHEQYLESDMYIKHFSTQIPYINIPLYHYLNQNIDYNNLKFTKIYKAQIRLPEKILNNIDYGVLITGRDLMPKFLNKDILLIHNTSILKDKGFCLYSNNSNICIKNYKFDEKNKCLYIKDISDTQWTKIKQNSKNIRGKILRYVRETKTDK